MRRGVTNLLKAAVSLCALLVLAPTTAYGRVTPSSVESRPEATPEATPDKAHGRTAVRVELLTMSRSADLFARFGHAAFRVHGGGGEDVVYNFGYTSFDDPVRLVLSFLRGRALFWVEVSTFAETVQEYRAQGREVRSYRLALSDAQHRKLAELLELHYQPANRYYVYHHFNDNCATRLRDLLDRVFDGAIRAQLAGRPTGQSFRELAREGFAGRPALLLLVELVLGRDADQRIDRWQAGFLPRSLAATLRSLPAQPGNPDGPRLASAPQIISPRQGPDPVRGNPYAGAQIVGVSAVALSLLASLALFGARRRRRWAAIGVLLPALLLGLCGLLIWTLAIVTTLPELRFNELLLVSWPTDLLLLLLGVRLLRGRFYAGPLLRGYLAAHLIIVVLVVLGHVSGLLVQQPRLWLLLTGAPLLLLWLAARQLPPTAMQTRSPVVSSLPSVCTRLDRSAPAVALEPAQASDDRRLAKNDE